MSKAEDKYIRDNKERIDNAPNPEKKEESLRTFFQRRVEKGDFIIENGDYKFRKLTDDEQKDVDAANKKFGNKDGGKQKFKEGSKPDFLDLDKDGNKTEPMKQAAKQKVTAKGGVRTAISKIKKAKDGARTGVRGTGAAKRGFRKARLS
jgi:hypothetical protein|tara:strand:+ start:392 stop:838 length:447 start_codon:yes stop_codon:yes gene_type:complete